MNYAQIRSMDISNGEGVGVSIFVQGCPIHCKGCFNSEEWDFNGGKEWTEEKKNKLLELLNKPYISRFSVLGGEPLAKQNMQDICKLCKEIKDKFPEKKIWLYSGYQYESLSSEQFKVLLFVDVLVDGRYDETLKNPSLKFRGSSNQRVINLSETLKQNKIILYCD